MAKRYDPILCMMVDEPAKAQDAMPSDLKKAGYEVGTVEKYGSTYYTLVYNGKVISTSPTEANIVEKAKKHYANRHGKAQDVAPATQRYINTIVDESKANAEKFVRQAEQDDEVPENELKYVYKAYNEKFGYKFHDSASALDKAIKTCDAVDDIYVRRNNDYYVNVKLGKSNPQISATISRILNKDKRVEGVLGSPGNWDVAIEGKDNVEYIKKILSGVGNIK